MPPEDPDKAEFEMIAWPEPTRVQHVPRHGPPRDELWVSPNDVPVPLRHNIKYAVESGIAMEDIAVIYDIPVRWVMLFCLDSEGNA